jgi:hypothetical protein
MKKFIFLFWLLCAGVQISLAQTTKFFEPDTSLFVNPETGPLYLYSHTGTQSFMPPLENGANTLVKYRTKYGFSTVFYSYYIGEFKRKDLSQDVLDRVNADMATARRLGYKVIPHFHYAYEYTYSSEKYKVPFIWEENELDAKKDIIVRHCRQLKPILAKNADVIALMG